MTSSPTNWTKNELLIYLLIHCMEADFNEDSEEIDFIRAKTDDLSFRRLYSELNADNDYVRAQKILASIEQLALEKEEIDDMLNDMLELLKTDGNLDETEMVQYLSLKKLLLAETK